MKIGKVHPNDQVIRVASNPCSNPDWDLPGFMKRLPFVAKTKSLSSWLVLFVLAVATGAGTITLYEEFVQNKELKAFAESSKQQKMAFDNQTVDSQVMGGAVLAGLLNDAIKKVALGDLPPDAPEVLEILQAIVHEYNAGNALVADKKGVMVAYWAGPGKPSGTGKDIGFRPYFQQAMKGSSLVYPAVGTTTGERAFYFAAPIYRGHIHHSEIVGVLAISIKPDTLDRLLLSQTGHKILLSPQGVVFGADTHDFLFRVAHAITATTQAELNQFKQFGNLFNDRAPQPLEMDLSTDQARIQGKNYAVSKVPVSWNDPLGIWTLVLLEDMEHWFPQRRKIEIFILLSLFAFLSYGTLFIALTNYFAKKNETIARLYVQKELANKTELLEIVIANLQQGLIAYDGQLRLILCNKKFRDIMGIPESLTDPGCTFPDLVRFQAHQGELGPGDPERLYQHYKAIIADRSHHQLERIRPNGTIVEIQGGGLPGGGFVSTYTDITVRKKAEQEIQILSSAVEQSPISIVITDPDATIEYVNPSFVHVSGYSSSEAIGQNPKILKSGNMPPEIFQSMWETIKKGLPWKGELLNRKKNGEHYWEATTISPICDDNGRIIHYVANKEDITQRKMAEEKLRDALKHISSSIHYASRIQQSILVPDWLFQAEIPEHFILWEPRDVVGGDMYWYRPWVNGSLLLLGDCTGHGVPGAFMTLIANGALDQALMETPPGDTAVLLQRIHQLIQVSMGQDQKEGDSNDGLELGACFLNFEQQKLTYSGARFSLFVADDDGVREIKGDKSGIGYRGIPRHVRFTPHHLELRPDRYYYMMSDGLIDQVGSKVRCGFGKRRFMDLIQSLRSTPIQEHGDRIKQALLDHQGEQSRRDDVTVIGFRGVAP